MKLAQLLSLIVLFASPLIYESAAIELGFEEEDLTFREGRNQELLFLRKDGPTTDDICVTILLLEVGEFLTYINNTNRNFSQDIIDRVNDIDSFATAGSDFNDTAIKFIFGADEPDVAIEINEFVIFDDLVNEPIESFVLVLEIETNDTSVVFIEGFDALRFNIIDNDDVTLGFSQIFFSFDEDAGVLIDVFRVELIGGIPSEQDITFDVEIFVNGNATSATIDEDFIAMNGLYTYTLTIPAGETFVYIDPIEIFDDFDIEGDEMFFIMLTPGPEGDIEIGRMLASITIYDNDFPPPSSFVPSPTPSMPMVDMGGDPHYSIMLPSGQLLCFSVHGEKNFPFNLISNDLLQMNAFFIEDALRDEITWIGSLGVVVQHTHYKKSNTTKLRFEAHDQMIYINNGVSLHAKRVEKLTLKNGALTVSETVRKNAERNAEIEVDLVDIGLTFSVRFVKKRHLDMSWKKVINQPTNSHGIIGQFMRDGVWIDEVSKLLHLPSLKPVPVMRSSVWHFMERETPDPDQKFCWQAMNPGYQGKRLIEGTYLDYLVDDVLSSDFKFKEL